MDKIKEKILEVSLGQIAGLLSGEVACIYWEKGEKISIVIEKAIEDYNFIKGKMAKIDKNLCQETGGNCDTTE